MLINPGVTHQHSAWLDRLRPGGRLLLPLTGAMGATPGKGVMIKVTRGAPALPPWLVTFVVIYSGASVRDPQLEPLLGKAMASGALMKAKAVRRDVHAQSDYCVLHGNGVCLCLR
jgi:protein-L-isoaspartate(D-aspartate) O-methyltransferase